MDGVRFLRLRLWLTSFSLHEILVQLISVWRHRSVFTFDSLSLSLSLSRHPSLCNVRVRRYVCVCTCVHMHVHVYAWVYIMQDAPVAS